MKRAVTADSPARAAQETAALESDQTLAMWLVTGLIVSCLAGYGFLRSGPVMVGGASLPVPRALFAAINAATLTGFQQSIAIDQLLWPGQVALLLLMLAGTFVTLVASALAIKHVVHASYSALRLTVAAVVFEIIAVPFGAAALFLANRPSLDVEGTETGRRIFASIFNAASGFGNCGLHLPYSSVDSTIAPTSFSAWMILMPLSMLGGLGLIITIDLILSVAHRRRPAPYTLWIGGLSGIAFVVGFAVTLWMQPPTALTADVLRRSLELALDATFNTRSAGFPIHPLFEHARVVQWLMMLMMALGGTPGGTGGGLRLATIGELVVGTWRAYRGELPGRRFAIALVWVVAFALLGAVVMAELLIRDLQLPPDRVLFTTVSAISNVGLSHDPLSITQSNGFVLGTAMLLGRLLPIAILWWMAVSEKRIAERP